MHNESAVTGDYEMIGRFIYGFHRYANPDQLRVLPGSALLAPDLAARGAALARRFDAALARRFDAALAALADRREEAALHAILADLQSFVKDSGWTHDTARA